MAPRNVERMNMSANETETKKVIDDAFAKLAAASHCRDLYISLSRIDGLGLFAARRFSTGERLYVYPNYYRRVETVNYQQINQFNMEIFRLFQVNIDGFALPEGIVDDFFNHSCEPNCGIRDYYDGYEVVALAEIASGDELCYDYSTYMSDLPNRLVCSCGALTCRKEIGPFGQLPVSRQHYYLNHGVVARFIKEQLGPISGGGP